MKRHLAITLLLSLCAGQLFAAAPGRFAGSLVGPDSALLYGSAVNGVTTYAMASLNTGYSARFIATDTRDITAVRVNWSTVSSPGQVTLRIETNDATSGKPTTSPTLYDANATKAFTPSAGWQLVTFDTPPTTGLTAGTEYHVVLLTTTGGTTQTLRAYVAAAATSRYPCIALTAADGTTRTNFAEVSTALPIMTVVFEDGAEEYLNFSPYATLGTYNIFGTAAAGMKFVVPAGETWSVRNINLPALVRTGTPAGDLRGRIFNSSDSAVSHSTVTLDKDSMTGSTSKRVVLPMTGLVTLTAGTYRVVLDSSSSANSSNCWTLRSGVISSSALASSAFMATNTADVTAGTISWTDTNTEQPAINLDFDDITTGGTGTSIGRVINGN